MFQDSTLGRNKLVCLNFLRKIETSFSLAVNMYKTPRLHATATVWEEILRQDGSGSGMQGLLTVICSNPSRTRKEVQRSINNIS
jgi:hypothetical protein